MNFEASQHLRTGGLMNKTLEKVVSDIGKDQMSMKKEQASMKKKIGTVADRLNKIEPHKVERFLSSVEEDVKHLHERLQIMILKVSVCTEVSYYMRLKHPDKLAVVQEACVLAFDKPDEYWDEREAFTVGEWCEELFGRQLFRGAA